MAWEEVELVGRASRDGRELRNRHLSYSSKAKGVRVGREDMTKTGIFFADKVETETRTRMNEIS